MENIQPAPFQQPDEEMNLGDLLRRLKEYWVEIKRNWLTIGLICIPFLVWQGYMALTTPVTYSSSLTFMVNEDTSGGASILNSLLGDFGIGQNQNNYDKILELGKSMRIIRYALFSKADIDGKTDYLANHFIRIQHLHEKEWSKKPKDPNQPSLNGFLFTRDSFEQFSRIEYAAFKSIYSMLIGGESTTPLFSTRYNQDSGIMSLSVKTRSETLTILLLRAIFDQLSAFYILSATEKQKETYDIIKEKTDSLLRQLSGAEYSAARFSEQSYGLMRPTDQLPGERFSRNKNIYTLIYGESLKNLELADFALKNRIPYVQPIDFPIPPITGAGYGKKKALGLGLGLGLVLGLAFVMWKMNSRQLKSDKK
ncbi:MAG: hypothetical protein LCH81_19285 [Bacteroidetes bacterium]|nr:hypothetical protein [Bacteroidota bacterium]